MMINHMRLVAFFAAVMLATASWAKTQDVGGRVINMKGEPLPFVNVVLLSLPDSAFVQGSVTDEQGLFQIVSPEDGGLLKVSCMGYETLFVKPSASSAEPISISMTEDSQLMSEVVVKSSLPRTHAKGDAMRTTVAGTILEKAGTVSDALSRIPSVEAERDGGVKVLGRGEAEVYINGRKVLDASELSRLRSDQIQYVDVVQNPGARYAASTKAVVRIQLKKAQGEGFSFQENANGMYQYGYTLTNNLDVNYRTGGLDITASFWAGRYGHAKSLQDDDLTYYVGPKSYLGRSTQDTKSIWKGLSPQLQVNYMVNENHSFGAFYKYDYHPSGSMNGRFLTDTYEDDRHIEHSESHIMQEDRFRKHIFNAYYNGKFGQLGIDLNVDGLFDDTQTPGSTEEVTSLLGGGRVDVNRSIESNTKSGNNFWASKLILSYPVWRGNLSAGGEYSNNNRTDAYDFSASNSVPVKATDTEIKEASAAGFVEYGHAFGKVFTQVGLRYEHLKNDYYNFGERESDVCRNYGDWFPTAVISAPIGQAQLSLSYRRDIERPNYSHLTSSTIYINRLTYQSGNPYLKPTYTHSLVLNAAYKWANMSVNYGRIKDAVTMSTQPFPDAEDPTISLVRPINTEEDYDQVVVLLSARPTVNFKLSTFDCAWHPTWTLVAMFQNYKTPTATGEVITLNRPMFSPSWQNVFELPHGFRLNVDLGWSSKGEFNNFRITKSRFRANIGLQRDFNLHSLGTLTADLRCIDILNTNTTDTKIFGYRDLTVHNPARRTFLLDLTWRFNEARSKYRGSGAGDKQKARM